MFEFLKRKPLPDYHQILVNQAIGSQSVLYSLFAKALQVEDGRVRRIELTYFALTTISFFFLRMSRIKNKETVLDHAVLDVFRKCMPQCGEAIPENQAIAQYQKRFSEYTVLLQSVFAKGGIDSHACVTLTMHLYESVTNGSAQGVMLQVAMASPLIGQFLADTIGFVKTKLS